MKHDSFYFDIINFPEDLRKLRFVRCFSKRCDFLRKCYRLACTWYFCWKWLRWFYPEDSDWNRFFRIHYCRWDHLFVLPYMFSYFKREFTAKMKYIKIARTLDFSLKREEKDFQLSLGYRLLTAVVYCARRASLGLAADAAFLGGSAQCSKNATPYITARRCKQ